MSDDCEHEEASIPLNHTLEGEKEEDAEREAKNASHLIEDDLKTLSGDRRGSAKQAEQTLADAQNRLAQRLDELEVSERAQEEQVALLLTRLGRLREEHKAVLKGATVPSSAKRKATCTEQTSSEGGPPSGGTSTGVSPTAPPAATAAAGGGGGGAVAATTNETLFDTAVLSPAELEQTIRAVKRATGPQSRLDACAVVAKGNCRLRCDQLIDLLNALPFAAEKARVAALLGGKERLVDIENLAQLSETRLRDLFHAEQRRNIVRAVRTGVCTVEQQQQQQ